MKYIILVFFTLIITSQIFAQESGINAFQNAEDRTKEVKIYPNPCKDNKVTIDYSTKDISEIRLTNITGKQVYHKKYDFPTPKVQLQLNEIQNGIYLIQITTTDHKRTVKKLMISRN